MSANKLFDHFTEKFKKHLPESKSMQEAFDKTQDELGFQAYANFHSYNVRRRKRKK